MLTWLGTSLSAGLPRWSLLPFSCFKHVWHRFLGCLSLELFTLSCSQARQLEICNILPGDCASVCSRSAVTAPGDCAAVCSRSGINKIWTLLRVVWVMCASHGTCVATPQRCSVHPSPPETLRHHIDKKFPECPRFIGDVSHVLEMQLRLLSALKSHSPRAIERQCLYPKVVPYSCW